MTARSSQMKVSTMETTVVSHFGHATQRSLGRELSNFRDNTYNRDSTLHEADMNS
jgi:hypothetical protein